MISADIQTGYAPVNDLKMYYETHGEGNPLILLHGGFGLTGMFAPILPQLAQERRVIALDLYGHGRTALTDRPLSLESMGDDVAAFIEYLGLGQVDIMGYSMGGGVALQTAIHHPNLVRRLVLIAVPFRKDGWYPDVTAQMSQMSAASVSFLKDTIIYQSYVQVAPRPEDFPRLAEEIGNSLRRDYDWGEQVAALEQPVMLVFGDADSVPITHIAEFFALLGGGLRDGGWDRTGMSGSRLAILPGTTHYDVFMSPALVTSVLPFLQEV